MTNPPVSFEAQLRQLQDSKMAAVGPLSSAAEALIAHRRREAELEVGLGNAYRAAIEAGWTEKELAATFKAAGLQVPAVPKTARKSRTRKAAVSDTTPTPVGADADTPARDAAEHQHV